jgi:hypothetical protein
MLPTSMSVMKIREHMVVVSAAGREKVGCIQHQSAEREAPDAVCNRFTGSPESPRLATLML